MYWRDPWQVMLSDEYGHFDSLVADKVENDAVLSESTDTGDDGIEIGDEVVNEDRSSNELTLKPDLKCGECSLHVLPTERDASFTCIRKTNSETVFNIHLSAARCDFARVGSTNAILSTSQTNGLRFSSLLIRFVSTEVRDQFCALIANLDKSESVIKESTKSLFNSRTDDSSASQYFQFYGYLSQQQNMMQDYIRTSTYQRAIHENYNKIAGKVVLDVGAGSGILSFFAVQAGAAKVYAVEASSIAVQADQLVKNNGLENKIKVICGKIEEIDLPEKVDVIISEPMGYLLFNERMLETFLHAKKWLKSDGQMLPNAASLYIAPFTDEALYLEQISKSNFWLQTSFYGIDLSSLKDEAVSEYFRQPVVDTFDPRVCLCKPYKYDVNFMKAQESDLYEIRIEADFGNVLYGGIVHGVAFWFDVTFPSGNPSDPPIWLSTSPSQPLTHWYQVRCLLSKPIMVNASQEMTGSFLLRSNTRQSYDIDMEVRIKGKDIVSKNTLDLKNPYFRYTGQPPAAPPGQPQVESPTDSYYGAYGQPPPPPPPPPPHNSNFHSANQSPNIYESGNPSGAGFHYNGSPQSSSYPNGAAAPMQGSQYPVMGAPESNCNINNSNNLSTGSNTGRVNSIGGTPFVFDSDFDRLYHLYGSTNAKDL
ncbi:hypothetical protein ACOME3_009751 [Neoechinorhynchus agilis]